jgi:hypothetical protein
MTPDFEHINYNDDDRIAILENRAAELERRLLAVMHPGGLSGWGNVATPGGASPGEDPPFEAGPAYEEAGPPYEEYEAVDPAYEEAGPPYEEYEAVDPAYEEAGAPYEECEAVDPPDEEAGLPGGGGAGSGMPGEAGPGAGGRGGGAGRAGRAGAGGRAEALVSRGRPRAGRRRGLPGRWRLVAAGAAALLAGVVAALAAAGGPGAGWPASVAVVRGEVRQACANPDVAAEPGGLDFACAPGSQPVLWVFSLLTSGDNPGFVDPSTGRRGLEPVQPAQGGDIAWSLNLHHPYDPASPVDSLMVAARAVNDIVYGATLTSPAGGALVEPGLESTAAGCRRYTGSARLVTRPGYPARCAAPVSGPAGQAALVSDVFQRWMGGTPSRVAAEAGVLFVNAGNPGSPQVQAILASLPASGG